MIVLAYRIARGTLAVSALVGGMLFAGWHVLVWRMGCVYRQDAARR